MRFLLPLFILFFSACSVKNYEHTQTKLVVIKSPKIKFADIGYIRNSDDSIELELFVAGNVVDKITINHLICLSAGCMSKSGFNSEYLNSNYPEDTLQNILLSKPIYTKQNYVKNRDGFEQHIKTKDVDIKYIVTSNMTYFKDMKNRILFKIKNLTGK